MFKTKKGVSPLIATILLIAFSVALGAVVMNWGESYISTHANFANNKEEVATSCSSASFSIIKYKDSPQVCQRGNTIEIFISNGPVPLNTIRASVIGENDISDLSNILDESLAPAGSIKTVINYGKNIGLVKMLSLTPVINNNACTLAVVKAEDIKQC